MVASIREVARMSAAGVSWKPFGKRASGPAVLFDLAMQVTPSCGEWAAAAAYSGCGAERKVRGEARPAIKAEARHATKLSGTSARSAAEARPRSGRLSLARQPQAVRGAGRPPPRHGMAGLQRRGGGTIAPQLPRPSRLADRVSYR